MTRTTGLAHFTLALLTLAAPQAQASEIKPYQILPGSTYTYKSGFATIPGGQPSESQLDFGVGGTFDVEFVSATARLLNVELVLTGNEAIQMNPPPVAQVTADRVEEFLEGRLFNLLLPPVPFNQYQDQTYSNFYLYDFLNGVIRLEGGFDSTPVDGPAMLFNINAQLIPEPSSLALLAITAGLIGSRLRRAT